MSKQCPQARPAVGLGQLGQVSVPPQQREAPVNLSGAQNTPAQPIAGQQSTHQPASPALGVVGESSTAKTTPPPGETRGVVSTTHDAPATQAGSDVSATKQGSNEAPASQRATVTGGESAPTTGNSGAVIDLTESQSSKGKQLTTTSKVAGSSSTHGHTAVPGPPIRSSRVLSTTTLGSKSDSRDRLLTTAEPGTGTVTSDKVATTDNGSLSLHLRTSQAGGSRLNTQAPPTQGQPESNAASSSAKAMSSSQGAHVGTSLSTDKSKATGTQSRAGSFLDRIGETETWRTPEGSGHPGGPAATGQNASAAVSGSSLALQGQGRRKSPSTRLSSRLTAGQLPR